MVASLCNFYGKIWVGFCLNPLMLNAPKWSDTLWKSCSKKLKDFKSVSDYFETLCMKVLTFKNPFSKSLILKPTERA